MATLLVFFARKVISTYLFFIPVATVGLLVANKLGGLFFYTFLLFLAPFFCLVAVIPAFQARLVTRNWSWILSLPLSKKNVIVLNYLLTLINLVVCGVAIGAVYFLLARFGPVDPEGSRGMQGFLTFLGRSTKEVIKNKWNPYVVMGAFLLINFVHTVGFQVMKGSYKNTSNPIWFRKSLVIIFLISLFCWLFRAYTTTAWTIFGIISSMIFVFVLVITIQALGMPRRQAGWWLGVSIFFVLVEMGVLYGMAKRAVDSQVSERLVSGIKFLGPFSGKILEAKLADVLVLDLDEDQIFDIGKLYQERFCANQLIRQGAERKLRLQAAIEKKTSKEAIEALVNLFDPAFLSLQDVLAFYSRLAALSHKSDGVFRGEQLLSIKVSTSELLQVIQSKTHSEQAKKYAFIKLQIHRDPDAIPVLLKSITGISDSLKEVALQTLSLHVGHRLGWDDYVRIKRGEFHSVQFYRPNCAALRVTKLKDAEDLPPADLNVCLRERAAVGDPAVAVKLHSVRWLDKPLGDDDIGMIQKIFALKQEQ